MTIAKRMFLLLACLTLASCSPMLVKTASDADDSKAKQFVPDATKAIVYIYRDGSLLGGDITTDLFVNDNSVATGARGRFNVLSLPPGRYAFTSMSNDLGALPTLLHNKDKPTLELTVESGKLYFLHEKWVGVRGFFLVTAPRDEAEQVIKKGKLIAVRQL